MLPLKAFSISISLLAAPAFAVENIIRTPVPTLPKRPPIVFAVDEAPIPSGQRLSSYSYDLSTRISGLHGQATWEALSLPSGITISEAGLISGIPSVKGNLTVAATVNDEKGAYVVYFPWTVVPFSECATITSDITKNNLAIYSKTASALPPDPNNGIRVAWNGTLVYSNLNSATKPYTEEATVGAWTYYKGGEPGLRRSTTFEGASYYTWDHPVCRKEA